MAVAALLKDAQPPRFPLTTIVGALCAYLETPNSAFQPMNANFGLLPSVGAGVKDKNAKKLFLSEKSLKDVLEVRRSLEELAIELACQRMTEEDMQALEEAQKAFKAAIDQGDAMKIAETDEAYHDVIYHSTRNKRLVQILNNLREQMYRFRLEYIKDEDKRQILQLEHEKILAALRLRHMAEAKAVARGHIDNQEITVLKNLKERKEV